MAGGGQRKCYNDVLSICCWPLYHKLKNINVFMLCSFPCVVFEQPTVRMADAETLLMETSDQNGNEGEDDQNGAEQEQEQESELMVGEDGQEGQDGQDNGTDGGKIDASKGEEDAG